jgi:phosphatidylethanolamine-binding protein (PEBP) family uncharacterized protein
MVLAACGGGVSKSSSNSTGAGGTSTAVTGSAVITVAASATTPASVDSASQQFLLASGDLNPAYTCDSDTAHANPPISWTQGPSDKTVYYVVIIDDPSQVQVNTGLAVRWIVRTSATVIGIHSGLTNGSNGLSQISSTQSIVSNPYSPPYQSDVPHTYHVRVYAMDASWLPDPNQAAGPGADFSNVSLPTLTSPSASGQNYYGGDPNNGFEQIFASHIVGSGSLSGIDQVINPVGANGC